MDINTEERLRGVADLIFETVSVNNDKVKDALCIFRGTIVK